MAEITEGATKSNDRTKQPSRKDEVMGWLLLTMLCDPRLLQMRDAALKQMGSVSSSATEKLEALGCKRKALITAAILGSNARKFYPPIDAQRLREIAIKLRSAVREMNELVPQVFVPWGQILEDGSLEIAKSPAGGDMQLESWVEKSLLDKATLFEELAAMCTAKEVPTRAEFGGVGHIWPLVYAEAKTGKPQYALVARLLQETAVHGDMTGRRLREAYVSIKKNHSAVIRWLCHATAHLETLEADGHWVIFASAYDQNSSAKDTNE